MFSSAAAFLHGRWRLWSICHINRHVFFHNSINFSSIFSLQNSISANSSKVQNTSYMTSWPTNWVNWDMTFRTDRWQLFTLWTCRQLDVELSWVELCRYKRAFIYTTVFLSRNYVHSVTSIGGEGCGHFPWTYSLGNRIQAYECIIFNDLERPLTQISRSRHYLMLNISENVRDTYLQWTVSQ